MPSQERKGSGNFFLLTSGAMVCISNPRLKGTSQQAICSSTHQREVHHMTIAARNNLYLRKLLFSSSVFDGIISWHQGLRQACNSIEQIGFTSHWGKPHTYIEFYSWTASCSADPGTTCRQCQCNPRPVELTSHWVTGLIGSSLQSLPSSHSSPSRSSLWSQVLGYVPRLQYNSWTNLLYTLFSNVHRIRQRYLQVRSCHLETSPSVSILWIPFFWLHRAEEHWLSWSMCLTYI